MTGQVSRFSGTTDKLLEFVTEEIARAICDASSEASPSTNARGYIVGGWCRDRIFGRTSPDVDMEVFGVQPKDLNAILQRLGYHVIAPKKVGTTPWKVIVGSAGTIDVTIPLRAFEVGQKRRELQPDPGASVLEAALRRDFTCNSIYFDPVSREFVDPHDGIRDIQEGLLRLLPEIHLNPGIPLRACRIAAQLNLRLDQESRDKLRKAVAEKGVENLSRQHLTKEFLKLLLESPAPSKGLILADELGLLQQVFPDISALRAVPQSQRHHPEGSVFNHTMMVVDEAAKLAHRHERDDGKLLMLAALFHDVGKLHTTKVKLKDGIEVISAHGHQRAGLEPTKTALRRLELTKRIRHDVLRFVAQHMKPLELSGLPPERQSGDHYDNKVRMLVRDVGRQNFKVFIDLSRADQLGRGGIPKDPCVILKPILDAVTRGDLLSPASERLLTGQVLADLGFENSHGSYERIIRAVEDSRDRGKIKTTEEAIRLVLRHHTLTNADLERAGVTSDRDKEVFFRALAEGIHDGTILSRAGVFEFLEKAHRQKDSESPQHARFTEEAPFLQPSEAYIRRCREIAEKVVADEYALLCQVISNFVGLESEMSPVAVRVITKAEAADIYKRELDRYYDLTKPGWSSALDMTGHQGFFVAREATVYIVPENIFPACFDEVRNLLFHELVHAVQHQEYPEYGSYYLYGLLGRRAEMTGALGSEHMLGNISKSIRALRHWEECHAKYFEFLYADETLWDIPGIDLEQVRWILGLDTLFENGCIKEDLSPRDISSVVHRLFSEPWLVDAVFRDDGIVGVKSSTDNRSMFEKRVNDFCKKYTTRDRVKFVYFS